MLIGDVAKRSGLAVHTLRYYEEIGLLPKAERDKAGRRFWSSDILTWLAFLNRLNDLGMPIRDRVLYARLRSQGEQTVSQRRDLLEGYRLRLREKISGLTETLKVLDDKIALYDKAMDQSRDQNAKDLKDDTPNRPASRP